MGNAFSWTSRQSWHEQDHLHAAVVEGPSTSGLQVLMRTVRSRDAAACAVPAWLALEATLSRMLAAAARPR